MANSSSNLLDGTLSALSGGLTSISAGAAVSNIESWQQTLQGAGLNDIANTLGDLKAELTSGKLDGSRIGPILSQLGQQTSTASQSATPDSQSKLSQLGALLSKAGSSLG